MLKFSETLGDEGNSSREGDQPLVWMLNVEQAATRLGELKTYKSKKIRSNYVNNVKKNYVSFWIFFFAQCCQAVKLSDFFRFTVKFKTFIVRACSPERGSQWCQCPFGRTPLFSPVNQSEKCKWFLTFGTIHLFHGNVNGSKPGSIHPEETNKVGSVVHHRDVHLNIT